MIYPAGISTFLHSHYMTIPPQNTPFHSFFPVPAEPLLSVRFSHICQIYSFLTLSYSVTPHMDLRRLISTAAPLHIFHALIYYFESPWVVDMTNILHKVCFCRMRFFFFFFFRTEYLLQRNECTSVHSFICDLIVMLCQYVVILF